MRLPHYIHAAKNPTLGASVVALGAAGFAYWAGRAGYEFADWALPFLQVACIVLVLAGGAIFLLEVLEDTSPSKIAPKGKDAWLLHHLGRYLGHQSRWAAKRTSNGDDLWITDADGEALGALAGGRLTAWGQVQTKDHTAHAAEVIPSEQWKHSDFSFADRLYADEPDVDVRLSQPDGGYYEYRNVLVSKHEAMRIWPRRGYLNRLFRRSPAERTSIDSGWRNADDKMRDAGIAFVPGRGWRAESTAVWGDQAAPVRSEKPEMLSLTEAAQSLYTQVNEAVRRDISTMAGAGSVTQVAKNCVLSAAGAGVVKLEGRREPGLPHEVIDHLYAFGTVAGPDDSLVTIFRSNVRTLWHDVRMARADLGAVEEHCTVTAETPDAPPAPPSIYPYRKAVLQVEDVNSSRSRMGDLFTDSDCWMDIRNHTAVDLKDCSVHVVSIECDGVTTPIDRKLKNRSSVIPRSQMKRFTFIHRDLKDVVSRPPHLLKLEGDEFGLVDGKTVRLNLELRSEYEFPTKVVLALQVPDDPEEAVRPTIESQQV